MNTRMKAYEKITLTSHAKDRLRQRVGIESLDAGIAWVRTNIERAIRSHRNGHFTYFYTEMFEIIMDGEKVVTVKPAVANNACADLLRSKVTKEVTKFMRQKKSELKKAEIALLETQLNLLKAKSPKVKRSISERLADLTDGKAKIEDEIKQMELAAESYGVRL